MIVAVANTKGGTGKTTTAVQLALYRKIIQHRDVWLVDGDEQETALTAMGIRVDSGVSPEMPCSLFTDGRTLMNQIRAQASKWDDVIIDVGGRATETLRAAMMVCDVLVIPVQPRCYDVWALSKLEQVIQSARSIGAGFKTVCFLSGADSQGRENDSAIEAITTYSQSVKFYDTPLIRRKAFAMASGNGLSVFEYRPKDQKACQEVERLAEVVFEEE